MFRKKQQSKRQYSSKSKKQRQQKMRQQRQNNTSIQTSSNDETATTTTIEPIASDSDDSASDSNDAAVASSDEQQPLIVNTKKVTRQVREQLIKHNIAQSTFAQLILSRSQGTFSDLLRKPKPWSKLRTGQETFRKMWKWLQMPEPERIAALRSAGE